MATKTAPAAPPPAAGVVSPGQNEFCSKGFRPFSKRERDFVKADLLPGDDEYAQPSPPPEGWPPKRRPPHLLPRRALFPRGKMNFAPKGFAPFQNAKEISSKPTSSPAMTNTPNLHLLPRDGHQNGARRTSSRGGRCFPGAK